MEGREVVIRTLDIGADKQIGYFNLPVEENPAMGNRALRICLNRPIPPASLPRTGATSSGLPMLQ